MFSHFLLRPARYSVYTVLLIALTCLLTPGCHRPSGNNEISDNDTVTAATTGTGHLRDVTFLPYWVTTAQFAGYYVAAETGIYRKHGIRIHIIPYQPFITPENLVQERKADFAALWLVNAIKMRASGTDIINIAQLSSRSSLMLITKKKSGIDTPEKMNGKRAGIWNGFELQPRAMFKKYHLKVQIVPIGSSNTLFLLDGVEITNANWFDEYHSIINSGYDSTELNTFFFADYGLNFLEDGIYCLAGRMKEDPGLCKDFVEATLEGWEYAFSHPEKTIDIVMKYAQQAKMPVNRSHQQWMLERYRDLYLPKGKSRPSTTLSEKDYHFAASVLKESDLIKTIPAFGEFYQPVIHP